MANAIFNFGVLLAFCSTVGVIYTVASAMWKRNSQVASQSSTYGIRTYEGLWLRCTIPYPGQLQCDHFDESLIGLPVNLQAQRAMMCIAAIFSVFGVCAGVVGMDCISVMRGTNAKVWTRRSGGGLMLLSGVLTLATASWYAAGVTSQYYYQTVQSNTFVYEFGAALYVGWVTGALAVAAGIFLAICGGGEDDGTPDSYKYSYNTATKPSNRAAEYV